jgi:hypothetical protein
LSAGFRVGSLQDLKSSIKQKAIDMVCAYATANIILSIEHENVDVVF